MKQVNERGIDYLLIGIEDDFNEAELTFDKRKIVLWDNDGRNGDLDLPAGQWSLLGKGDQVGDEAAVQFTRHHTLTQVNMDFQPIGPVEHSYWVGLKHFTKVKEAFIFWLRSHGFEPQHVLLLKSNS